MPEQNAANHSRYILTWHLITPILLAALLGGSIVNFTHARPEVHYSAALLVLVAIIFLVYYWYTRAFALKAQDRAIRAEENLRHFILTGKPLDKQLRLGQIIALRFASDEEFPSLAKKAVEEKMPPKEIKLAIKNWRADHNRV